MSKKNLHWLHLSDFHTGKDQYGQIQLFDSLIYHIENKIKSGQKPELIFITGDIANKGKKEEYELFCNNFMFPLCDLLSDTTKIFIVPGNHDVDRDQARATRRYGVLNEIPNFFDPDKDGLHERKVLFPRFENYVQADMHALSTVGADWLFSEEGFFTYIHEKDGTSFGILGVNTAWLSEGDNDRHHLSPGKPSIESGLKKVESCRVKLVLGHHSLDWYDEDSTPIRSIFGKNGVIYLHGHLHKNSGSSEVGAGRKFLTIQSGAAFQARESEKWINRLLWCELDSENDNVKVQPLQWSKANQEWALDGIAFAEEYRSPGTDYWVLPLKDAPQKRKSKNVKTTGEEDISILPLGWSFIDRSFLDDKQRDLADEAILNFFDGRVPSWREALTHKIPRRKIVNDIVTELTDARRQGELRLTLILGAGGEGKSTVFYQTIADLASSDSGWKILWLANPARDILWPNKFLSQLPQDKDSWLIASDDADLIAKYLFETTKSFRRAERGDIQFLLCCRDSDWLAAEANEWQWKEYVTYVEKRLRGITQEDAEIIIKGWSQLGSKGLGSLSGLDFKEAVSRLYLASKSEEEKYQDEGAFLGAMLRVRMGDELKLHVKALLLRLKERRVKNETLMDAFAYIAAMHAEHLFILTKDILAEVLSCKLSDVKKKITGPLGDEAAASTGGDRIFTRHRAIAEAAVEVLSDIFHIDFDEIFLELAESAFRLHYQGLYVSNFTTWHFLADHFIKKGKTSLAVRLDQSLLKIDPFDRYLIVHLSRLLRETGQPDLSVNMYRKTNVQGDRAFFFEWGVAEELLGNYALTVWLNGIAMSDKIEMKPIDNRQAKMCICKLTSNFFSLFESYSNRVFLEACIATIQIGRRFQINEIDRNLFDKYEAKCRAEGMQDVIFKTTVHKINLGLIKAWEQREVELSKWVLPAPELTFKRLTRLIEIEDL